MYGRGELLKIHFTGISTIFSHIINLSPQYKGSWAKYISQMLALAAINQSTFDQLSKIRFPIPRECPTPAPLHIGLYAPELGGGEVDEVPELGGVDVRVEMFHWGAGSGRG